MADEKPNLPPFWIFLPGAIFVGMLIFLGLLRSRPMVILEVGLLAPCVAGILCRIFRRSAARLFAIWAVAAYWMGLGALTILMMTNGIFLLLYYGIAIVPTVAIVIFATHSARKRMASLWIPVGAGLGFACGVVAIVIAITPVLRKPQTALKLHFAPTVHEAPSSKP